MGIFSKSSEKTKIQTGKFIVIDGPDGSGKATQTKLLAQTLSENNYNGVVFDFPQYNTVSAGMLEKYLAGGFGEDVGPEAASIFYAVDRYDASFKLRKFLNEGHIVLSNRYMISNAGHQGAKIPNLQDRLAYYKWLDNLEYGIFQIPKPDINIILHVPAEISWQLIEKRAMEQNRPRDIHELDREHLKTAEKIYLELAELIPNTKIVECTENGELLSPGKIHAKVWELIRRIVLK